MKNKLQDAITIFDNKAEDYAIKFQSLKKYHDGFDFLCERIIQNGSILDLACGPGNISNYLLSKRPDFNLLGIDLAPSMIKIAKKQNPSAKFKQMDIRKVKSLDQVFNSIVVGFGTPYLSKEEVNRLIIDSYDTLSNDGIIYLSTMEGNYESSDYQKSSDGKDKMFIYYHESIYIKQFLVNAGFRIIWEKKQPFMDEGRLRFNDYIVIASKFIS